ncbi:MAG TPA: glycosyltransferase [Candidatus Anoxymicrobiaceae bacterium]
MVPELSIVITTKDRCAELLRCLESISRAEGDVPSEVIIVDDCSSDGTRDLESGDVRERFGLADVSVFHSEVSLKMVKARNTGARLARGRLVLFVDDDNVIDPRMITELVRCADSDKDLGILGPSMYMLKSRVKYLDNQTINLYTMRTKLRVDGGREVHESDGIPNVFMVKKEVFEQAGYFDHRLVQSFTEPDFSYNARRFGFRTAMCSRAVTYHDIDLAERGRHMGSIPAKAYCLMRNRFVINTRYGLPRQRLTFLVLFSWVWPVLYSLIALRDGNPGRIPYYFAGFFDGFYYALTGKFRERKGITC